MSNRTRTIYESVSRRNLIQLQGVDKVVVSAIATVSQDGSGNFTTINDAISAAPNNSAATDGYFLIYVTAGVYEEYVSITVNKRNLMMIGDGIDQTIITGNRSFVDSSTTFNSATFVVVAPGFVAVNITFRNTAGAIKYQAVTVRNGADMSTFYSCSFEAYQDTLYTHSLRQFYRECDIYGTVDFIFGNAAVVFKIVFRFIIVLLELLMSWLGAILLFRRTWEGHGRITTIYMETFMDRLINPSGWIAWKGDFALSTLHYVEYNNTGPGSNTTNRVSWPTYPVINNATEAANFTVANFLLGDDWLPQTGVPYNGGLI
nr:putative pectinesterase/pectinesterase inhibitor 7 [Quercus suber]